MYQHILLAVALQQWDEFSPHAVAAREAAVALAHGSGARLSVLSVYDYDYETPEAMSLPPEEVARYRDTQMVRMDERMATKMQAFLAGVPTRETPITPLLKVGDPRQLIIGTAEALGSTSWSLAHIANAVFSMSSWAGRQLPSAATPPVRS